MSMTWKEYAQTASVRQWAMIYGSIVATVVFVWGMICNIHFLDNKKFTIEQFFQLTKFQLQINAFETYIAGFAMILFVVALTLTKFSAVTKAGSLSVGGEDDTQGVKVTTETKVEKTNGDGTAGS